ncbi:capsid protein [Agrobacterium tumefaciens]|uniref:phage major capsid protein n=1 Tax=Agrobacterium tumefaciens TaxID=358 RepID=UPI000B40339A|nr:phage major capsid protein [Agrobacterium tumefaciens]NSY01173.1 phage major capsid protein [Agrobacterium tumefaciens]OVE92240.1 capsid protein [Agrobacterium tumefaciens]
MADNQLADKIGELGTSLASIKEQVGNLATDFTSKLAANGEVSAELKEKTDKALSELGDVTTRLGDLEKRAARERDGGDPDEKSLGDIVVEAAGAQSFDSSYRGMIKVKADRAAITSANTTVGAGRSQGTSLVPGARVPGIFGLPERQLTIRDLVMPGQTSSSTIEYVKETGFTNNAAPVAETTAKPYSDLTFDMTSAPVRTIAHLFKASRQILDDAPALRSYIDGRARYGLRFVEENQLLNGSGTGQNLHGLVPQATAFNPAFAAADETAIDRLRLAVLQVVLAEYPATAFVLNPIDWAKIELTKDAGGNYIIGNPQGSLTPTLWNLPVVSTQAMAAGEFLTGAFSFASQIFDRMDIEVLLSSENVDDFEKNLFTIRAEERLAFAVYRPESFVTGDVEGA